MKLTYKEFCKNEFEEARKKDWFDPNGNSVTASCNRTFFDEAKLQVKRFNRDIAETFVNLKLLLVGLVALLALITIPITYIPLFIARVWYTRKCRKKEMMESYKKYLEANK